MSEGVTLTQGSAPMTSFDFHLLTKEEFYPDRFKVKTLDEVARDIQSIEVQEELKKGKRDGLDMDENEKIDVQY